MKDEHKIAKVYQQPPINRRDHSYGRGKRSKEQRIKIKSCLGKIKEETSLKQSAITAEK